LPTRWETTTKLGQLLIWGSRGIDEVKGKLVVEALSLPEGDPSLLDGLPWQSFNHPKGEND